MDAPFPIVDVAQPVDTVAKLLSKSNPAVLVRSNGTVQGIVTRSDMLNYLMAQIRENHGADGRNVVRARRVAGDGHSRDRGASLARTRGHAGRSGARADQRRRVSRAR